VTGTPRDTVEALAAGVRGGERRALARALTLVESTRADARAAAVDLLERLAPDTGNSIRIGISGAPGAGKSTLIEALGMHVIKIGHRVAVLSLDPSSALGGGSILGDKTRMTELSRRCEAFIRPSPAGHGHGGVARRTREAIMLCEAAGYDVVMIETVGVGQAEVAVAGMSDMLMLILIPGAGDELQGIKRGIVELADLVVVNKADGELATAAGRAAADYRNALRLLRPRSPNWDVPVLSCSAANGAGVEEVWNCVEHYRRALAPNGELAARRGAQARRWFRSETTEGLLEALRARPATRAALARIEGAVAAGTLPPTVAAQRAVAEILATEPLPRKEATADPNLEP